MLDDDQSSAIYSAVQNLLRFEYVCVSVDGGDGTAINYLCYEYRIRQKFHLGSSVLSSSNL